MELAGERWGAIVLDESTRIKNPKAQITQLCVAGFRLARHRFVLSGLPAPEGALDFFPQFQFQTGQFLGVSNYWAFRHRYFVQMGYDWVPRAGTRALVKAEVGHRAFSLSRKEAGFYLPKVYERRYVEPTSEQTRLQTKAMKEFALDTKQTNWTVVVQTWLAQLAGGFAEGKHVGGGRKLSELVSLLLGDLLRSRVLVFARFNAELAYLARGLESASIRNHIIDGGTHPEKRQQIVEAFRAGSVDVLLLQIKVARFGLDLSAADAVIYYSNSYSLEDRVQSEDRAIHPQKMEPVLYVDLCTRGTVDEDAIRLLQEKRAEAKHFTSNLVRAFQERAKRCLFSSR